VAISLGAGYPPGVSAASPAPSLRRLLALAWPIVVSRSAQVVVGIGDAVMVAHHGEGALAATTAGSLNAFSVFILPMGIVFIVSSFSSQLFGAGDLRGARRYGFYGLAIAAATQVLGIAAGPLVAAVVGRLAFEPAVAASLTDYLVIRLWAGGAVVGTEALGNYYGGLGNTRVGMRVNVLVMLLDLPGNWLLIDGRLGFPAMGVRGAALSSVVSTLVPFLAMLAVFLADGRRDGAVVPRLRARELGRMLRFGLPSGLNWFLEFSAFLLFINVILGGLGTTALAAFMAVLNLNSVAFMPAFGIASAGAILVGQSIGARLQDHAVAAARLAFLAAAAWQLLVGLGYLLAPRLLLAPFAREAASAPGLLEVGARMLMLSVAWQLFDATASVYGEALRAAGDTLFAMWARVVIAWGVFLPGTWLTVRVLGAGDAVAVGWVVGYLAVLACVLWLRFRSGVWRRIRLVEPAAA
jgi:MATE family multidrug resistance protein